MTNKTLKIYGLRTWCTKNLSVIESHTTTPVEHFRSYMTSFALNIWINIQMVYKYFCFRAVNLKFKNSKKPFKFAQCQILCSICRYLFININWKVKKIFANKFVGIRINNNIFTVLALFNWRTFLCVKQLTQFYGVHSTVVTRCIFVRSCRKNYKFLKIFLVLCTIKLI